MATRIETLGGGRRAPKAAWIMLFAIVMITAAVAVGTLIRSDGFTKTPARSANEAVSTALEPATQVPGLIKARKSSIFFAPPGVTSSEQLSRNLMMLLFSVATAFTFSWGNSSNPFYRTDWSRVNSSFWIKVLNTKLRYFVRMQRWRW